MPEFIDLRTYDGPTDIRCDICIAGAGAAGITLARELAVPGTSVVVLEAGGSEVDGATQILYSAANTGIRYRDLASCRLRYFGGTTNHWGGRTNMNSPLDFAGMPEINVPGWPLSRDELIPYLQRAADQLDHEFDLYKASVAAEASGYDPALLIENESSLFGTIGYLQTARRRFATEFREELEDRDSLRLFLYANLTHIQLTENAATVDHFRARSLSGKELRIHARAHVLACHAIENARLLLTSNDVQTNGIGNLSDQVGRNFMEHVYLLTGQLLPSASTLPALYMSGRAQRGDRRPERPVNFVMSVTDDARRREQMLSYYARFRVTYADDEVYEGLQHIRNSFFEPFEEETLRAIMRVVSDLPSAARITQEEFGMRPRQVAYMRIHQRIDQAPNPDSRITLTAERDALDLPRVNLHWDVTDLDVHTFQRGQELMVQELSALGFGRFVVEPITAEMIRENLRGHNHHMGTTRMSASPSDGVVDADCRVHGLNNLYVAGSSTWPNGGSTGPTMTIIAMAIRLADHLKGRV